MWSILMGLLGLLVWIALGVFIARCIGVGSRKFRR